MCEQTGSPITRLLTDLFSNSSSDDEPAIDWKEAKQQLGPCSELSPHACKHVPATELQAAENYLAQHANTIPPDNGLAGADVPGVPGLRLIKGWLDTMQQAELERCILASGVPHGSRNQAMFFGTLPSWVALITSALPPNLLPNHLASRDPLFNQIILNRYQPGEGLTDHVDLARFQDGIVSVSLGGPAIMHFSPLQGSPDHARANPSRRVQVLLEGGDLLVLTGPARYLWKHGIRHVTHETHEPSGKQVVRGVRISVTLRRTCDEIVLSEAAQ